LSLGFFEHPFGLFGLAKLLSDAGIEYLSAFTVGFVVCHLGLLCPYARQ